MWARVNFASAFLATIAVAAALAAPPSRPRSVRGVHTPLPVTAAQTVAVPDAEWLLHVYAAALGRPADAVGFRHNFALLEGTAGGAPPQSRDAMFAGFVGSAEFASNAALHAPTGYVNRSYAVVLRRYAAAWETNFYAAMLTTAAGAPAPGSANNVTWPGLLDILYGSTEYRGVACHRDWFPLGAPLHPDAAMLADLFNGSARLQNGSAAATIALTIPTATDVWDQKLPLLHNPFAPGGRDAAGPLAEWYDEPAMLSVTRAFLGGNRFTLALLNVSADGLRMAEIAPLWPESALTPGGKGSTFYDAHIAVDHTVCPPRYILSLECAGNAGLASLCTSFTTHPSLPFTYTSPVVAVDGCANGHPNGCRDGQTRSASTGIAFVDNSPSGVIGAPGMLYQAWTDVDDSVHATFAQMFGQGFAAGAAARSYHGTVEAASVLTQIPIGANPREHCTGGWDCDNSDNQDWKQEGEWMVVAYNGGNTYRCDGGQWGSSLARRRKLAGVAGAYDEKLPLASVVLGHPGAQCGCSYPTINVVGGQLFLYYAWVTASGQRIPRRSRLEWVAP